jgi:hypothetical protein
MHAAKKYQVRKEARMEFRIEDARGKEKVAWVVNGHGTKQGPKLQ